ncbi:ATP-binding protein [Chryseobacterium sp. Y16C]|uniref:ATP-binding protein n=1 Tax=Chryseobacterium sp. Y16C TaxID=2920939 RepID=UPI001F0ACBD4|nr:ATP-binding protein [Chryseobacterium sp. Y16C]UMQ41159.1 ATP-binding protein [Chryseobacterium sp. Y16C]
MSTIEKEKNFNPKAQILTLLGNELIKSPVMAIYELVKNSYDADANKVDVKFRDVEDIDKAVIIIEDDGIGMTSEIIEDVWLEPGSDFRKPVNKRTGEREIIRSAIYNRVPMGEKGVGRFAVHKLSNQILLITRPQIIKYKKNSKIIESSKLADYEIQLYIDWKDFNQSKHLSDVPIKWKIKRSLDDFRFKDKSGTYIRLSNLKEVWTKGMARDLKIQTLSMLSPKVSENQFSINLNFDNKWLIDFPSVNKILDESPFKITAFIDKDYNLDFEYTFALKNNSEIGTRHIKDDPQYNQNIRGLVRKEYKSILEKDEYDDSKIEKILSEFDSKPISFGGILIELNTFDLDISSMRDYTDSPDLIKKILKDHSGIKVFKNDLRIYDYGSPGNDWLGLDLERIQNKKWFSNNNIIGYVYLDAETSTSLVEKTNREGFVENQDYLNFYIILKTILNEFATTRFVDRNKWLSFNQKSNKNLFDSKVSNLKTLLDSADLSEEDTKRRLIDEVNKLEEKYEEDKQILLIPAGVGMTASVALHEIEKLIPRMQETVTEKPLNINKISDQVQELKQYSDGITSVLRKGGDKPVSISECINIALANYKLQLKLRKINFELEFDDLHDTIKCDKRYFITIAMNILDNSIYWLDAIYSDDKSIFIKSFKEGDSTCVLFVDNGPGFKDDISDLIRPFFSRKTNGIGIGLYLIDTIMMKYGKVDIITETESLIKYGVPKKYNGAAIILIFNKNQL